MGTFEGSGFPYGAYFGLVHWIVVTECIGLSFLGFTFYMYGLGSFNSLLPFCWFLLSACATSSSDMISCSFVFLPKEANHSLVHCVDEPVGCLEAAVKCTNQFTLVSIYLGFFLPLSFASFMSNNNSTRLPRKRFYRARAHSNPLSDSHFPVPIAPSQLDYSQHFPYFFPAAGNADDDGIASATTDRKIQFADVGCGFGGLLISLSTLFPDTLMIGMELRDKVTEYVKERILALRAANPGFQYENISVVRTNSMKYIPNYFEKGQLSKMFFLFPDPHFKEKNHRRRVISPHLLDEYGYTLQVGGIIYTITDVEELGDWMRSCLEDHPLFEAIPEEELKSDPVVKLLAAATEEGQKVARNGGQTFQNVYRRIASAR